MKGFPNTLLVLALVAVSPSARASCRWLGTQVDCTLGSHQLLIGTQVAAESSHAGATRALPLNGGDGLFDDRAASNSPILLELQNIGKDPGLCWRFGNETYCH